MDIDFWSNMDEIVELITEAKNGNGEAFEKICEKYAGLILQSNDDL